MFKGFGFEGNLVSGFIRGVTGVTVWLLGS